jgi:hypothetical protein
LLIIVGDPTVLGSDDCWGALLKQCVELGVYFGPPLPSRDEIGDGESIGARASPPA